MVALVRISETVNTVVLVHVETAEVQDLIFLLFLSKQSSQKK